jgi:hypothetical protein
MAASLREQPLLHLVGEAEAQRPLTRGHDRERERPRAPHLPGLRLGRVPAGAGERLPGRPRVHGQHHRCELDPRAVDRQPVVRDGESDPVRPVGTGGASRRDERLLLEIWLRTALPRAAAIAA